MITALDHVVLVCPSIDDGEAAYTSLLGREPDWRHNDAGGSSSVFYKLENTAIELMSPSGGGPVARRLHILLEQDGVGLKSLAFLSNDLAADRAALDRRGLKPDDITPGESVDHLRAQARYWNRLRLDDSGTHGVRMFVLERRASDPVVYRPQPSDAVSGLDHVVINTPNPDRAAALYGARLGLRLALDRANPDWDTRLMFFRVGNVTVELAQKLSKGVTNQPDKLWGLSWRTPDIEATHARLEKAGFAVTSIRMGRRPGSKVFTVRGGTLNVPTLILSADPKPAP